MSTLQNMKAPNSIKKGRHNKIKQRRPQARLGKNGGIQTPSKKKRTSHSTNREQREREEREKRCQERNNE